MVDPATRERVGVDHPTLWQKFSADRETSEIMPFLERPVTVMYPYERLEDLEPWLFVPGNYNGRIGIIWETCTACKACVRVCPNDCLHMTSEVRVNVLDTAEEGDEWHGYGSELEEGGFAARKKEDFEDIAEGFDLWFDASRTRVLPAVHQERVDMELKKRAEKELKKRERKAARAAEA